MARPPGRWLRGIHTSWPEYYARAGPRELGLPRAAISPAYLRGALHGLLDPHVTAQRDCHLAKARRLAKVHHRLDLLSQQMFLLAVVSVTVYLTLKGAAVIHLVPASILQCLFDLDCKLFRTRSIIAWQAGGDTSSISHERSRHAA